jgi:general L-amino acid transport system permease protein
VARRFAGLPQAKGEGACWAFIAEKHRFIFFGTYPYEQHWRPATVILLLLALYGLSAWRRAWHSWLALVWAAGLAAIGVLMWGGVFGLSYVENERWGGLALTLLLATFGIAFAFPLSILLALGRRSQLPVVRAFCIGYIELVRGVPLISLLFMASVMLPLFLPEGMTIDKLLRAQIAMILFAAPISPKWCAAACSPCRASSTSRPTRSASATGRRPGWSSSPGAARRDPAARQYLHRLSQGHVARGDHRALRPADRGQGRAAGAGVDGFGIEAYLFASLVYFVFCYAMSRYSQGLERDLAPDARPALRNGA